MRKHSVRKWLHAILDLLPVILIPVFMIYSHRHSMTEQTQVDIQYKYQSNEIDDIDDLVVGNIYELNIENKILEEVFSITEDSSIQFILLEVKSYDFDNYGFSIDDEVTSSSQTNYFNVVNKMVWYADVSYYQVYLNDWENDDYLFQLEIGDLSSRSFSLNAIIQLVDYDMVMGFNLGTFSYTDYNVIRTVQIEDTNSSVTNVFMNNFTNTVDTYFNFNNTFNLGDIWTWIDTNLFSGNSPAIAFSIWNIICYEFLMDLLFVFYAFFMFLMDFVECVLEKPFNRINRR